MKVHFTTLELPHGDPLIGAKVRLKNHPPREGVIIGRHEKFGYEVQWTAPRRFVGVYFFEELETEPTA